MQYDPPDDPKVNKFLGFFCIAYAALVCHVKLLSLIKNSQNRTNLKVDFSPTGVHPQGGSNRQRYRWPRPRPPHPAARRTRLPAVPQTGQGELTTCLVISVVRTHTDFKAGFAFKFYITYSFIVTVEGFVSKSSHCAVVSHRALIWGPPVLMFLMEKIGHGNEKIFIDTDCPFFVLISFL